ncbi:MAG: VacJ family lipoprotein [Candidatus Rokubacteria bacterium]|nr:VacJ family lipoprotein [Candidatus Rokubacteria bacterium]
MRSRLARWLTGPLVGLAAVALSACGSLSGGLSTDTSLMMTAAPAAPVESAPAAGVADAAAGPEEEVPVEPGVDAEAGATPEAQATEAAAATSETGTEPVLAMVTPEAPLAMDDAESYTLVLVEFPILAQAPPDGEDDLPLAGGDFRVEEWDPWEPFNEKMFAFNKALDDYAIKPVATVWDAVVPDELKQMISRAFNNIRVVPRVVNNALQGKFAGAGIEVGRFLINTVVGIAGFWDIAQQEFGIEQRYADFGQTLGKWGVGPGPFLVLPLLPPMTIRDGIGRGVDTFLNPFFWFGLIPLVPTGLSLTAGDMINDRALNLELFGGLERDTLDLYTAVRNAYLARRAQLLRE